jgi:hypothetical protein
MMLPHDVINSERLYNRMLTLSLTCGKIGYVGEQTDPLQLETTPGCGCCSILPGGVLFRSGKFI